MTDERYKEIMLNLGMPDSTALLIALQQVANEVAQEIKCKDSNEILEIIDCCFHAFASNYKTEAKEYAEGLLK